MNIAITARGYKAPARLQQYIMEKTKRIDRFSDKVMDLDVILSYEKLIQVAECKAKLRRKVIVVKERSDDVFKSVDLAIDNLERQIAKEKAKEKKHDSKKIVENLVT
jgi:putative sigma-54 modulation protein